jgi:hypothetical protein
VGRPDARKGGFSGRPGWPGGIHRRRKAPGGKWGDPAQPGGQPFKEPGLRWRDARLARTIRTNRERAIKPLP